MRKSIKHIGLFTIMVLIMQITIVFAEITIPPATDDFYVNDFAGIFSSDEKTRLQSNAVKLSEEKEGIQVVITTVESLEGIPIEDYANEMYNQYAIGKDDMGVLIFLSTNDRDIRVETGKAMEAYINDAKAGRLIDIYALDYLKNNNFSMGLINLQEGIINEIETNVEYPTEVIENEQSTINMDAVLLWSIIIAIFLTIFSIWKWYHQIMKKNRLIENLNIKLIESQNQLDILKSSENKSILKLKEQIAQSEEEKQKIIETKSSLQDRYNALKDRYSRAMVLYPNLDNEITTMIEKEIIRKDMKAAEEVDECIEKILGLSANIKNLQALTYAREKYLALTDKQRTYVKADINKLESLYQESLKLKLEYEKKMREKDYKEKADNALKSILAIISDMSIGRAHDLYKLKEANRIYESLGAGSLKYFDSETLNKLKRLFKQAKRDKEEEEERERQRRWEEERRRRQSSFSNSNFRSGSHFGGGSRFGGFGGRSGGGGASRSF